MPVVTCFDMVSQCRAGDAAGWRHFIAHYVPFAGAVLGRDYPRLSARRAELLREILLRARDQDAQFFRDFSGQSEREFLLHLREHVATVADEGSPGEVDPEIPLVWDVFAKALEGLTLLERQASWLLILAPEAQDAHEILRVDAQSVAAATGKAQDALRAACDRWSADMLSQNRRQLAQDARSRATKDCPAPKSFLRLLDGQMTWRDRVDAEHHISTCWRCVDLLCRFREVVFVFGLCRPLSEAEAQPYWKPLGIEEPRPPGWKRLFGSRGESV